MFGSAAPSSGGLFSSTPATSVGTTGGLFGTPATATSNPATGGLFGSTSTTSSLGLGGSLGSTPGLFSQPSTFTSSLQQQQQQPLQQQYQQPSQLPQLVPPPADMLLQYQLAAIETQKKELAALNAWRGNSSPAYPKVTPSYLSSSNRNGYSNSKMSNVHSYFLDHRRSIDASSGYKQAPYSGVKIRPRGFGPLKPGISSNGGSVSTPISNTRGPILSPTASTTKKLVLKPGGLIPKPKVRLILSDVEGESSSGGDKLDASSAMKTPNGLINKPSSQTPPSQFNSTNGVDNHQHGNLESLVTENGQETGFISPNVVNPNNKGKNLQSTPSEMSSQKKMMSPSGQNYDDAYDFYQKVISAPAERINGDSSAKKPSPNKASLLPKLTKKGYKISPSLEVLKTYSEEKLTAVSNFVVERKGYGSIAWDDVVDVRGLDVDKSINIVSQSVEVYLLEEEAGTKPPVGSKLNKPAVITVEGIYPDSDDAESKEKKKLQIRRKTQKMGVQFISYDVSTGIWKFRVQHFSRYGFFDDSDDEEEVIVHTSKKVSDSHVFNVERQDFKLGDRGGRSQARYGQNGESKNDYDYVDEAMPEEMAYDIDETPSEGADQVFTAADEAYNKLSYLAQMGFNENDFFLSSDPDSFYEDEGVDQSEYLRESHFPYQNISQVKRSNGICAKLAKKCGVVKATSSSTDFGMRMGRSFRVCWSPEGTVISPHNFMKGDRKKSIVTLKPQLLDGESNNHRKMNFESPNKLLQTHMKYCERAADKDGCALVLLPLPTSNDDSSDLYEDKVSEMLESYVNMYKAHMSDHDISPTVKTTYFAFSIISLLRAISMTRATSTKPAFLEEKECLKKWFRDLCAQGVNEDISAACKKGDAYTAIFAALSGLDIDKAVSLAETNDLYMLSLSLANLSSDGPSSISEQRYIWDETGASNHFPPQLMRIYSLLSRNLELEENLYDPKQSKEHLNLDWKRRLSMLLWSFDANSEILDESLLSSIISKYESEINSFVSPPARSRTGSDLCILYKILKLFSTLTTDRLPTESISETVSPLGLFSYKHDVSKSFHFASVLSALGVFEPLKMYEEFYLLDTYANILIQNGSWEMAVYVILCCLSKNNMTINCIERKKRLARDIIFRHYTDSEENLPRRFFLETHLGIPKAWFDFAIEIRKTYLVGNNQV
jgi:nuclear pore complex protein Nup98-Nup96